MKKLRINMLSMADAVDGQGVGTAYLELIKLLREDGKDEFEVLINSNKKKDYDIIHSHTVEPRNYLKMKFSKKPTIAYVHFLPDTLNGSIKLPKLAFWFFKKYVISFYKQADHLVVVNPIFKKDMVKAGLKEEKIKYIPNFVSKEKFYKMNDKERKELRNKYNIKDNEFAILGNGQVQNRKGVLDFVEVAKKMPDVKFIWAGGFSFGAITDGYEELKKVVENPPKNVTFLGIIPRDDMNGLMNACDLLFVPSYNELFPMAILEAISTSTPILLRNLELYEDILFKKYLSGSNNEEFIKLINDLRTNKKLYEEAVKNAEYISSFYSKDNVYKMWKEFYNYVYDKGNDKNV